VCGLLGLYDEGIEELKVIEDMDIKDDRIPEMKERLQLMKKEEEEAEGEEDGEEEGEEDEKKDEKTDDSKEGSFLRLCFCVQGVIFMVSILMQRLVRQWRTS